MNVATLWLETTSHSHFLTLRADSGTTILRFSLTLTWHPNLQWSSICFLLKNPTSVGRIVPPPSSTRHLHWPQLPLPPQADGRKIFCSARVASSELPGVTSTSFWPSLMLILTFPDGVSLILMKRSSATSMSVTTVIVITAIISVEIRLSILSDLRN